MDANIDSEFKTQTKTSKSESKMKRSNKKSLVKIEPHENNGSLVLRLRKYGTQHSQNHSFENSQDDDNASEKGLYSTQTDIEGFSSKDHSINIADFKTMTQVHPQKEDINGYVVKSEGINGSLMSIEDDISPSKKSVGKESLKRLYSDKAAKDIAESAATPDKKLSRTEIKSSKRERRKARKRIAADIAVKVKELSKKDVKAYPLAYTQFGFSHPLVQQHVAFLKSFFSGRRHYKSCVQDYYGDFLELRKPVKVTKGFYLVKVGHPFFTKEGYDDVEFSMLEFYDGFVSLRQHVSFLNAGMLVYFYQAVVYVKEIKQMVYVIVPEDQEDLVLFHTNPDVLLKVVYSKIRQVNQDITRFRKYKAQKKEYRFGDTHTSFIREKIIVMLKMEPDLTALLNKTIEAAVMASVIDEELSVLSIRNHLPYKEDIPIFKIMERVFNSKLKACSLKIPMDIGEFFFGLKSPKALALREMFIKNKNMSFDILPRKVQQHFSGVSPKYEIKEMNIFVSQSGDMIEHNQRTERQFVDIVMPSQSVWYICKSNKRSNISTKIEEGSYSIALAHSKDNAEDIISGETASKCLEELVGKFEKGKGSRRIMMEFFENLVDQELREYKKEDDLTAFFREMYADKLTKDSTESIEMLKGLLEKNKDKVNKKKNDGRNWIKRINKIIKDELDENHGIEIIDEKILITVVK